MAAPFDLIVIGGGPAGCAAAISATERGLSVLLLERLLAPRERPGESLHPGAEALFEQLGVAGTLRLANIHRHRGCHLQTAEGHSYRMFGADADGPWQGFQIRRDLLDNLLIDESRQRGARVMQGVAAQRIHRNQDGRPDGVTAGGSRYEGRWIVDASGDTSWLRRQLGVSVESHSPQLFAWYGYVDGWPPRCDGNPQLIVESEGWTWVAPLGEQQCAWVCLSIGADAARPTKPPALLASCAPIGPVRGKDVSWRILKQVSGRGFFVVGDAASVIDPASSHGVLTALTTGIMAAHSIAQIQNGILAETAGIALYHHWLRSAFKADVQILQSLYRELGILKAEGGNLWQSIARQSE